MAKKPVAGGIRFSDDDSKVMEGIMFLIMEKGFVTPDQLHKQFGDTATTKALAILHKLYRCLVEGEGDVGGKTVKGYRIGHPKFSQAQLKKMPPALAFLPELFKASKGVFGEYKEMAFHCRFLTPALGALPTVNKDKQQILAFERWWNDKDIIIQRFGVRAMLGAALRLSNRPESHRDYFGYETVVIKKPELSEKRRGGQNERGQSIGIIVSECLAAGTEFILSVTVPTTYIKPHDFIELLKLAGRKIGLSPGRSAGYGDFEVLGLATQ